MKVKCINNTINPKHDPDWVSNWAGTETELEITVGKEYIVLGLAKYGGDYFYYVLGDETNTYPLAYPYVLFELVNYQVSKYWNCDLKIVSRLDEFDLNNDEVMSFKEWSLKGDKFYEDLLNDQPFAVNLFQIYKSKMLKE